jgi:hypothetical protein
MNDEIDKAVRSWEKLLNPQTLRTNLMLASLSLTAYELLIRTVVDRIRGFFTCDFMGEGDNPLVHDRYQEVKRPNSNLLLASCQWHEQNGAISVDDVAIIKDIRRHRNQIAHELPHFLGDVDREISLEHLQEIRRLLRKIEIWWIRNVDLTIDSNFDGVEVADEDIHPGPVLVLDEIIRMALDNEDIEQD